jgi:hypothetical protein
MATTALVPTELVSSYHVPLVAFNHVFTTCDTIFLLAIYSVSLLQFLVFTNTTCAMFYSLSSYSICPYFMWLL